MTKLLTTALIVAGLFSASPAAMAAQGRVTTMDYDMRTLIRQGVQSQGPEDVQIPVQTGTTRDWESGGYLPRLDIQ